MADDVGWLFGRLCRIDYSGAGPPWPVLVWDDASSSWQNLGIVGATGATGATGPAGLTWQGAWSNSTAYAVHDAVSDGGSAYVCIVAHTGQEPPNATYWNVLASKGDTGATGAAGATGASGPASSLLVLLPNPYRFVDDSATDNGQPPDFIMTAAGDVIGVGGA